MKTCGTTSLLTHLAEKERCGVGVSSDMVHTERDGKLGQRWGRWPVISLVRFDMLVYLLVEASFQLVSVALAHLLFCHCQPHKNWKVFLSLLPFHLAFRSDLFKMTFSEVSYTLFEGAAGDWILGLNDPLHPTLWSPSVWIHRRKNM